MNCFLCYIPFKFLLSPSDDVIEQDGDFCLSLEARYDCNGEIAKCFQKHVKIIYTAREYSTLKRVAVDIDGVRIWRNRLRKSYYMVNGNTTTIYTKHFSIFKYWHCGIREEYESPVTAYVYRKRRSICVKHHDLKIYLATVRLQN